ncbi:hypothetical protein HK102_010816 [Quaeritorhiza haematococci]|nr:hypothetical protein HK102_010816 [Quaeritorhiza haematococci]
MFIIGLLAALLGSCIIGVGQTIQKYALNRLQGDAGSGGRLPSPSPKVKRKGKRSTSPAQRSSRFKDPFWLLGMFLTFLGEMFAIVMPLGIVAVVVNAILAERYLGEVIRNGYLLIGIGVLCILSAAPKGEANIGSTVAEVLKNCTSPGFVVGLSALCIFQTFLIYQLLVNRRETELWLYVVVASLFGAVTVICGKMISVLARLGVSKIQNVAAASASATAVASTALPVLAKAGAEATASALDQNLSTLQPLQSAPSVPIVSPIAILVVMIVGAVFGAEFFKQKALERFPTSRFGPLAYAGFNICGVLTSVLLFREIPNYLGIMKFFTIFIASMGAIFAGIRLIHSEETERVGRFD